MTTLTSTPPAAGGGEALRIPSFGFIRGAVVRETPDGPNMLVVRGLGERTVVLVIEGDQGGAVRLRERPTTDLHQVLPPGDYAEHRRHPEDWEPPALATQTDPRSTLDREETRDGR